MGCRSPTVFKIVGSQEAEVTVFGKKIQIPFQTMIFNSVSPKIISRKRKLKPRDTIKLQMVPTENFHMVKSFSSETISH